MGQSLILLIEELAQGMTEAFAAVNDGFAAIEQAFSLPLVIDGSLGDYTLAEIDMVRYYVFKVGGAVADITFEVSSLTNGNETNRVIIIVNESSTKRITVQSETPGGTVEIPPLGVRMVEIIGEDVFLLLEGSTVTGYPLIISSFATEPDHQDIIYRYTFTDDATLYSNFLGSQASISTATLPTLPVRVRVSRIVAGTPTILGYCNIAVNGSFTYEQNTPGDLDVNTGDTFEFVFLRPEWGTITFANVADDADALLISDGATTVGFIFGSGADGTVNKGASNTDSATNLKTAIEGSALATNITVTRSSGILTLRNNRLARGGSIVEAEGGKILFTSVADNADDVTINDGSNAPTVFTFGGGGGQVAPGATAANSATNLKAAINAVGAGLLATSYLSTSTLLLIINEFAAGGGSITKTDGDNDYTVTNFSVDADDITVVDFDVDTTAAFFDNNVKTTRR